MIGKLQGCAGDRVHIPHEADLQPHGGHGLDQALQGDRLPGPDRMPHVPGNYSAVLQVNVFKDCVSRSFSHATSDHVFYPAEYYAEHRHPRSKA